MNNLNAVSFIVSVIVFGIGNTAYILWMPSGGNFAMLQALLRVPLYQILKTTMPRKTIPRIKTLHPKLTILVSFYKTKELFIQLNKQQRHFANDIVNTTDHRCVRSYWGTLFSMGVLF